MKSLIAALAIASFVAACGTANQSSSVKAQLHPEIISEKNDVFFVDGEITEVRAKASSQGLGLWTEVDIEYRVPCYQKFEKFSYSIQQEAGKTTILASAIASTPAEQGELVCQAFYNHIETISLSGIASRDSIELVNLTGASKNYVVTDVVGFAPLNYIKVVSTRAICPEGVACRTDGTIVTLSSHIICVNQIGPIAYSHKSILAASGEQTVELNVGGFEVLNNGYDRVRCALVPQSFEITLPRVFVDKSAINLNILK